jgi:hypothetical protein
VEGSVSNIVQFSAYRRPKESAETERRTEIMMAIEMLRQQQHFFERRVPRAQLPVSDFKRGWMCAAAMIEHPQLAERIEIAFKSIIEEAMSRRAKGGKNSRKSWTPASDGFLLGIAKYVATGEVYRPRSSKDITASP